MSEQYMLSDRFVKWSRFSMLLGVALGLVFVAPVAWLPVQLSKIVVFATFLFLAAVFFALGRGMQTTFRAPGFLPALLVFLLPVVYLVSMFFSLDRPVALLGFGIEADTVLFVALASIAFFLSFCLFRSARDARLLVVFVFFSLLFAVIFQWVSIVFGPSAIPFATFADRSINLIGKWNDLGLLVGVLALFILTWTELNNLSTVRRICAGALLSSLAVLLGIVGFSMVWWLILISSIVLSAVVFLRERSHGSSLYARVPWFALAGASVAVLFLFFGVVLNTRLTTVFPVSSLEVRPSYQTTLDIANASRGSSLLRTAVGTGPDTFGMEWLLHKPAEVNQSPFWNLDFNVGFSTLETALGTVGLLGVLAWLLPPLLVVAAWVRTARRSRRDDAEELSTGERTTTALLSFAVIFLWSSVALYVSGQTIILLAFVLAGATFGFLWRGEANDQTSRVDDLKYTRHGATILVVILVLAAFLCAFSSARRLVAESYSYLGLSALSQGDITHALAFSARALAVEQNNNTALRLVFAADSAKLQQIANDKLLSTQEAQKQFTDTLSATVSAALKVTQNYPNDYRSYLSLGNLYAFLASLNVQNAAQNSVVAYSAAEIKNPTSPEIPLSLARLAAGVGDTKAQQYLMRALTLKADYTDAIMLAVQLYVANKDTTNAIAVAKVAAQTAPGVASIWFQLGLLYYSVGNTADATSPLEQAVSLQDDYANAKYFLGLSYWAQNRAQDAIKQFIDLSKTNPDNAEVALVLKNMQKGVAPFTGAKPPVNPKPQNRATAPVSP